MQNTSMVFLALFDFVPNLAFLVGAYFMVRTAYLVRGKTCGSLVVAGSLLILLGGLLQATWKLFYSTGTADIPLISSAQFILMAPGFAILLIAVLLLAQRSVRKTPPPVLSIVAWKLPFLIVMVVSSLIAYGMLIFIAVRRRTFAAGAGFAIAFLCLLAMGGMASGEQTIAQQWTEEIVNAIGQTAFAAGSFLLYRNFKSYAC